MKRRRITLTDGRYLIFILLKTKRRAWFCRHETAERREPEPRLTRRARRGEVSCLSFAGIRSSANGWRRRRSARVARFCRQRIFVALSDETGRLPDGSAESSYDIVPSRTSFLRSGLILSRPRLKARSFILSGHQKASVRS